MSTRLDAESGVQQHLEVRRAEAGDGVLNIMMGTAHEKAHTGRTVARTRQKDAYPAGSCGEARRAPRVLVVALRYIKPNASHLADSQAHSSVGYPSKEEKPRLS